MKKVNHFTAFLRKASSKVRLKDLIKKLINTRDSRSLFYKMLFLVCLVISVLVLMTTLHRTAPAHEKENKDVSNYSETNKEGLIHKEVTVVVDPGHGGKDWGTHFGSIKEKRLNLDIALRFGKLLEKKGIRVIYTRKKDQFISLQKRPQIANNADATLYISIHNNNLPGNSTHQGTETLYSSSVSARFPSMNDKKLAEIIEGNLTAALNTAYGGIIKRTDLAVLHLTKMPAVIAEIGYLSNESDRKKLSSKPFRQKTAEALCDAVVKALSDMGAQKDDKGKWMVYETRNN